MTGRAGTHRPPVRGTTVLYHYLQKDLLPTDPALFEMLVVRLIAALGIWLHPTVYTTMPIILPFAARDPQSRGDKSRGIPDQWGSADEHGNFRDDNSLVKGIPRSLPILSPRTSIYFGRRMGSGFVASHVWREVSVTDLAARNWKLYSFVPNLVWLPADVAALSDREGSFVQTFLQALSLRIYRTHRPPASLANLSDEAWGLLPRPPPISDAGLPEPSTLNYFEPSQAWFDRRLRTLAGVVEGLVRLESGDASGKILSSRYAPSLAQLPIGTRASLQQRLGGYLEAVRSARGPG